jgi:hypothetical protein
MGIHIPSIWSAKYTVLVNYGTSMAVLVQYYFTFKEILYALHFSGFDRTKSQKQQVQEQQTHVKRPTFPFHYAGLCCNTNPIGQEKGKNNVF